MDRRCQHLPYVVDWVQRTRPALDLKLCTDISNARMVRFANDLSARLGISLSLDPGARRIIGMEVREWSEANQLRMMMECRAGIDIKGKDFGQQHKPATKAQQFVASGIPFATTADSYAYEHFKSRGLALVDPTQTRDWFARLLERDPTMRQ